MEELSKFRFPQIRKVKLIGFSLYTLKPDIEIDLSNGVFCLAGANGLGKSTFLAAVNYGITGVVPNPKREFVSTTEYFRDGSAYSQDFFAGRIAETDREVASITVHLQVGDTLYQLTRGVFEPTELQEFSVVNANTGKVVVDIDTHSTIERLEEYQRRITHHIGLDSFEQFVFLQHAVFTFDESRKLLLWNQRALNQAISLCIGADPGKAQIMDELRRDMEKADSLVRNYNWQATQERKEIEVLRKAMSGSSESEIDLVELAQNHKTLQEELEQQQNKVELKRNQLDDAELKWMRISSKLTLLEAEYANEFSRHIQQRSHVEFHPVVAATLSEGQCALCNSEEENVVQRIQDSLGDQECPLCSSPLSEAVNESEAIARLKEIDKGIAEAGDQLNSALKTKERLLKELQAAEAQRESKHTGLKAFEKQNEDFLIRLKSGEDGIEYSLKKKLEKLGDLLKKKEKKYTEREKIRKNLLKHQRELQRQYTDAEEEFAPMFQDLAFLFLGLPLVIRLGYSTSLKTPGVSLTLEVRGEVRREDYQLSESQRFFLDIALRMALARYSSRPQGEAALFIDTPEGSLDIAYESRAGKMFAKFAQHNHNIMMTANINSSQILQQLAHECGRSKMALHQMTSWTELSDVQLAEEELFQSALERIEEALDAGGNTSHT